VQRPFGDDPDSEDFQSMTKINTTRLVVGGLVGGVVMIAVSLLAAPLYLSEMMASLDSRGIQPPEGSFPVYLLMRLVWGFVAVWFYVAARPRFGPGLKTALLVGFVFWLGGVFLGIVSYGMLGLFPTGMLAIWSAMTLVAILASTVVGAWIYREPVGAAST